MIERYDFDDDWSGNCCCRMSLESNGDYVSYTDYAALKAELEEKINAANKELERLRIENMSCVC